MRLEPRRVLSVNASFVVGTLDVGIVNDGVGGTTATLHDMAGGQFYLDTNGNNSFDSLSEVSGAKSDLRHIIVNGDAGVGDFFWKDDFSDAPLDQGAPNAVALSNLHSANLSATANVSGNVSVNAIHTSIGGNLGIDGNLTVSNAAGLSTISIDSSAHLSVTGLTNLSAGKFDQAVGGVLSSDGGVSIEVQDRATIQGAIESTAGSIRIHSDGAAGIFMSNSASLNAFDNVQLIAENNAAASITANDIHAGEGILLYAASNVSTQGPIESSGGDITIEAGRTALISDEIDTSDAGTVYVTADIIRVNGSIEADDDIFLNANHGISVLGDIQSSAGQVGFDSGSTINLSSSSHVSGADILIESVGIFTSDGQVNSSGDIAVSADSDVMLNGSFVAAGNVGVEADRSIRVGFIQAQNVSLDAGTNIEVANAGVGGINIKAEQLQLVAAGRVGAPDIANGNADQNANAISLEVDTLAAKSSSGIYLHSAGNLKIGAIANFSSQATIQVNYLQHDRSPNQLIVDSLQVDSDPTAAEDLIATNGTIKVKVDGSLTVEDGPDANSIGVSAGGDVLLWASQSIALSGDVESTSGRMELRAVGNILANASITVNAGTLYIHSNSVTLNAALLTRSDILVDAAGLLTINGNLSATNGQVGLLGNDVTINSSSLINGFGIYADASNDLTLSGSLNSSIDVVLIAGNDIVMKGQATATRFAATQAGHDLLLGEVHAQAVTLSAGRNILDNNGDVVNVQADRLQMSAGGSIGASSLASPADTNPAAIDLIVGTVAAKSATGIYLEELSSANGNLRIGSVGDISASVSVQVNGLNFNSSSSGFAVSVAGSVTGNPEIKDDLVATAGAVKVKVDAGNLIVADGPDVNMIGVSASGDVLLWASQSIVTFGNVLSTGGQIELRAAEKITASSSITANAGSVYLHSDTIVLNRSVSANLDILAEAANSLTINSIISSSAGQIGLRAKDIAINLASSISGVGIYSEVDNSLTLAGAVNSTADILLIAGNHIVIKGQASATGVVAVQAGGDIILGQIQAQQVALTAGRGIWNINPTGVNVQADQLQMSASGPIGIPSPTSGQDANPTAIRLMVGTVAAQATNGIYIEQLSSANGDLQIGEVGPIHASVDVQTNQVSFNSSPASPISRTVTNNTLAQDGLIATTGAIAVKVDSGSLIVQDGLDADTTSVFARSDILLWASQSITIGGDVVSTSGQIELRATGDITSSSSITATLGTVYLHSNNITLNGSVSARSDVLADASDLLTINAGVNSSNGEVGLRANDVLINGSGSISGAGVYADATNNLTLAGSMNSSADVVMISANDIVMTGQATAARVVAMQVGNDILLGQVQGQAVTLTAARNILDNNAATVNVQADRLQMSAGGSIGTSSLASPVDINPAAIDLMVGTIAARASSGIYLQEISSAQADLTVGNVGTISGNVQVQVREVNFNGTPAVPIAPVTGTLTSNSAAQEDLVATAGAVKLKVDAGNLVVADGPDAGSIGISASGDVLLSASQSITATGDVASTGGQVELRATDSIASNSITATAGTIYIHSSDIMLNNAISASADILVDAADSLTINASVSSANQQVGLRGTNVTINVAGSASGAGIYVDASNTLTLSGALNSSADVVLNAGTDIVMSGQATASNVIAMQAGQDIRLGQVLAPAVTMTAGRNILDNNAATVNVQANRLQMLAGGSIGASSLASLVDTNPAALDLNVGTVAAQAANDIYLEEIASASGDLRIGDVGPISGSVVVLVNRVNFNSSPSTLVAPVVGSVSSNPAAQEDLVATAGAIRVKVDAGSLIVDAGPDANAVSARGDILLWATESITLNGGVETTSGQLELRAADNITSNAAITAGAGTLYIHSNDITLNQFVSAGSDVLLDAVDSLAINSSIASTNGQIGLRGTTVVANSASLISGVGIYADAANDLTLSGSLNSSANLVLIAGHDIVMSGQATATNTVAAQAGNDILLGQVQGQAVTLTATRNILDNNGSVVNVQADRLQMSAGGSIGASSLASPVDTNPAAIDLIVGTVAARAANGIYLEEVSSASGDLRIGNVGVISGSVIVQVNSVNFNGSSATAIAAITGSVTGNSRSQEDLVATAGAVKVKVDTGSLVVTDGSDANTIGVSASGDVLLWASKSITTSGDIVSTAGQIELRAADNIVASSSITSNAGTVYLHSSDIALNGSVGASSDILADATDSLTVNSSINSLAGQVGLRANDVAINGTGSVSGVGIYVAATHDLTLSGSVNSSADIVLVAGNDIAMSGQAISSGVVAAQASNDILLGQVQGQAVTLTAGRSILDNNAATVNVQADRLQMSAGGSIGASSLASPVDTNPAAIDLVVGTVAARAANGIYLQEFATGGNLNVGDVGTIAGSVSVQVNRVNFNSSPATAIAPVVGSVSSNPTVQEDLVATSGAVKVKVDAGSLIVADGPDANFFGVSASGDVLLWASQSLTLNGAIESTAGHIELRATSDIVANASVTTNVGTLYIHSNNIVLNAATTAGSDLLADATNSLTINTNISSTGGQLGLLARDMNINSLATVSGVGIYADATNQLTLAGILNSSADAVLVAGTDIAMSGRVTAASMVAMQASQDILLGSVQGQAVTLTAGRNILDNNAALVNVQADRLQMSSGGSIGASSLASPVDSNPAAIDLVVGTVAAKAVSGIYLQELSSNSGDLRVGNVGPIGGNVIVQVNRINFNSSPATSIAPVAGRVTSDPAAQEDLVATAGAVKVKIDAGSLVVDDGPDANSIGVSASGDILLWASQSITLNGGIESTNGQIELRATENITTNSSTSANAGTVYVHSSNVTFNGLVSANSDILADVLNSLTINSSLSSANGQVGLRGSDVTINAAGLVSGIGVYADATNDLTLSGTLNSSADAVLVADHDMVMSGQATASNVIAARAGQDILLAQVQAQAVTLTAGRNILDNNVALVNVQADRLQMSAGGSIGTSSLASPADTNPDAIDLVVGAVAARATSGIYLQELAAGGDLTIGTVGTIAGNVSVQVNRVNFNSSPATPLAPVVGNVASDTSVQEDLLATAGAVKVKVEAGSLLINDGPDANSIGVSASGDVLLWSSQSIANGGDIVSTAGQIELRAVSSITVNSAITANSGTLYIHSDSITLNSSVSARSDILADATNSLTVNSSVNSAAGQIGLRASEVVINASGVVDGSGIYADASNNLALSGTLNSTADIVLIAGNDIVMSGQAIANNVIAARASQDILLGQIQSQAVTLTAGRNILDHNAAAVNVQADRLQMSAGGSIGTSSLASPVDTNPAAIDLMVGTVAARAASGIYLQELSSASGDLNVGNVGVINGSVSVQVNRVNFNSSPSTLMAPVVGTLTSNPAAQEDLIATAGAVKVKIDAGSLTVEDGPDSNASGISASGDILLWASQSISISGGVVSTAGQIELRAAENIATNSSITANAGTVYLHSNNITLNGSVSSGSDVLVDAANSLTINANVSSNNGQIALLARDLSISSVATVSGVGIYADADNQLTLSGTLSSTADVVLIAGTDIAMSGQATAANVIAARAGQDILLGRVQAQAVTLTAGRNILDNNAATVNVQADRLQMTAGGSIGTSSLAAPIDTNPAAIDLMVGTVAAQSVGGIYLQEISSASGDLQIGNVGVITGTVIVQVNRVNFNSSPSSLIAPVTGTLTSDRSVQEDLVTATGAIKVKVDAGILSVVDGPDADNFGVSTATGDVLLWGTNGLVIGTQVTSNSGDITLRSSVDINVTATGSVLTGGSVYVIGGPINLNGSISGSEGVLIRSSQDILINQTMTSASGSVGLIASGQIIQNANISAGDDLFVQSGGDLVMATTTRSVATGNVVIVSGGDVHVSLIIGDRIGIDAAGDVLDLLANNQTNLQSREAIISATGSIGESFETNGRADENARAIDLDVQTISSSSGLGTYLNHVSAGRTLLVAPVASIGSNLNIHQAQFNSSNTSVSLSGIPLTISGQQDSTAGGVYKLVSSGNLTIQDGPDANTLEIIADGDVLLKSSGNVTVNGGVQSSTGNIALQAPVFVDVRAAVSASQNVLVQSNDVFVRQMISAGGNVLLQANDSIEISGQITSTGGSIALMAAKDVMQNGGLNAARDLLITADSGVYQMSGAAIARAGNNALINAANGIVFTRLAADRDVAVTTTSGNIIGIEQSSANIVANNLSLRAINGRIGSADSIGDDFNAIGYGSINLNALDINVSSTLAATSQSGIYLNQTGATPKNLHLGSVSAVSVALSSIDVNFNSTSDAVTVSRSIDALAYLNTQTSQTGSNRAIDLRNQNGSIIVDDTANVSRDGVFSNNGAIYLSTNVTTPGADGFILLGESVRSLGTATRGDIGLRSFEWISDSNSSVSVSGTNLHVQSQAFTHLGKTVVDTLNADVGRPGTLQDFQKVNLAASNRGDDFLSLIDMPGETDDQFYSGDPVSSNRVDPENFRFADRLAGSYSLYLVNTKSIIVDSVIGAGNAPHVYIETLGASDLTVHGTIATFSNTATEGAIVLVAGRNLMLDLTPGSDAQLVTQSALPDGQTRMQVINQFGSGDFIFNVKAFAGGDGINPRSENTSTEFVVDDRGELTRLSLLLADPSLRDRTDVFQRVVMQFGSDGESGFNVYLRYADGFGQEFNTLGDVGVRSILNSNNNFPINDNSIAAQLSSDNKAAVFSRIIAFESQFLFANENLPTLGVIRRADDFFLFQNAADAGGVIDMTYQTFNVENVKSRGSEIGFTQLLQDIPPIAPPPVIPPPELEIIQTNLPPTIRLELPVATEKQFEIAVYRVHFDDLNHNGYADDNELPTSEQVLSAREIELQNNQQSSEPAEGIRIKIESFSTGSGAPTSQQVEELKAELMNNPNMPTGAYSIVETDSGDSETVLDVFSVREQSAQNYQSDERIPLVRPKTKTSDESQSEPPAAGSSLPADNESSSNSPAADRYISPRFATLASTGTLAAAFWYSRRTAEESTSLLEELGNESSSDRKKLNRSARRARRVANLIAAPLMSEDGQ